MKKINVLLLGLMTVVTLSLFSSCSSSGNEQENVFDKKITVYTNAVEKVNAAKAVAELNDINVALEAEIATIDEQCADELNRIFEEKAVNADAYKNDEDSLKKAQTNYDDAYISKYLELAEAAAPEM
ncbi:MAG: hypothetical protein J6R07_00575 [Bacteroidaceae bacterium]|nr:hypothetical protein [Bacteroidaceae bacterium]